MSRCVACAPHRKSIWVEKYEDDDAECHSCGKVGRPRYLIHFDHLCQHFVALCGLCWKRLRRIIADPIPTGRGSAPKAHHSLRVT
jgi:hypothetical protein